MMTFFVNLPLKTATLHGEPSRQSRGRDQDLTDGAAALSTLGIGLASLDQDLRYLEINDWLASAQGLSAAEHRGRELRQVVPHLATQLEPVLRQVLATGFAALDVPIRESGTGSRGPVTGGPLLPGSRGCGPAGRGERCDGRDHRPGPRPGSTRGE